MKKKIIMTIIFALIIVVLIYFIFVIRRFLILNEIKNSYKNYSNANNYHIIMNYEDGVELKNIEVYFKDNNYKKIINDNKENLSKITYFVDLNNNIYFKYDENTLVKELISVDEVPQESLLKSVMTYSLISDNNFTNFINALNIFGYNIKTNENSYIIKSGKTEEYINKQTKLLDKKITYNDSVKTINYIVEFDNVTYEMVSEI